ncbi:hypothetical protein L9F63_019768 [Diploptera punctata]|uniref:Uncharacterized protein n=1 Tax=Diploptera punctata TaxID=6984 RepID=A0AAD8EDS3_DIPPU|nr:hypothetical protein L9F63_019768 [Diploptera punctata]
MKRCEIIFVLGLLFIHQGCRGNPLQTQDNATFVPAPTEHYKDNSSIHQTIGDENVINYQVSQNFSDSYKVPIEVNEENITTTWSPRYVIDAPIRPKCPPGKRYHKRSGMCRIVIISKRCQ